MNQKLIIIRGLPGSGKSTKAKSIIDEVDYIGYSYAHYEADMFWGNDYNFNIDYLYAAHQWCYSNVLKSLLIDRKEIVIVSNTFTTKQEVYKYVDLALELGVDYEIITCKGEYGSIHDVPDEAIKRMKDRWVETEDL